MEVIGCALRFSAQLVEAGTQSGDKRTGSRQSCDERKQSNSRHECNYLHGNHVNAFVSFAAVRRQAHPQEAGALAVRRER